MLSWAVQGSDCLLTKQHKIEVFEWGQNSADVDSRDALCRNDDAIFNIWYITWVPREHRRNHIHFLKLFISLILYGVLCFETSLYVYLYRDDDMLSQCICITSEAFLVYIYINSGIAHLQIIQWLVALNKIFIPSGSLFRFCGFNNNKTILILC